MAPKLRVLISSSSAYPPTAPCPVNSPTPSKVRTDSFEGEISVWVRGFEGDHKAGDGHEYFDARPGMTYAIVVRGRFLEDIGADELLFGNVFERPIRDSLPWGTSVAQKAIYFVEPTLEMDLYADRPWALSPALASMNHLSLTDADSSGLIVNEESTEVIEKLADGMHPPLGGDEKAQAAARKRWMSDKTNRQAVKLTKEIQVGMEFCNGYLDFNTLSLSLPAGFNMTFPLLKYWDGQPVTYVCQRKGTSNTADGKVFWSVAFEIVDEEAKKDLEKRGGAVVVEDKKVLQDASVDEASDDVD